MPDCDLDGGLREIKTDADVLDMFAIHVGRSRIPIYVENPNLHAGDDEDMVSLGDKEDRVSLGDKEEDSDGDNDFHVSSDCGSFSESDLEYFADGDMIFDEYENVGKGKKEREIKGKGKCFEIGSGSGKGKGSKEVIVDIDEVENDDLNSPMNSDCEGGLDYPEFNEERDMGKPELKLGMLFSSAAVFRAALREHSIRNGTDFKFKKNDGDRVTAVCKNECGWKVHASFFQDTKAFQIKSLYGHPCQCPRSYHLKHANSRWIANKYMDSLSDDPSWKLSAMRKAVKRDWMVDVSHSQVYRAKRAALEAIEGNHRQQYWRLWDYCEMIRMQNPGSTAMVKVERPLPEGAPVFQRLFVMYGAQKMGFLAGIRPMIGLDACHLKGPFQGQLMHAVARDGNNQMYPLAMAVVEAETKDSWMWFLEKLLDVIGRPEEKGWTFISDRQKVKCNLIS